MFEQATVRYKGLIARITNTHSTRHQIFVNLLGLTSLPVRFQHLQTGYQAVLMQQSGTNPLQRVLSQIGPPSTLNRFIYGLRDNAEWQRFILSHQEDTPIKPALTRYLQGIRGITIAKDTQ